MILDETLNKFVRDIINLILETPDFAIRAKQQNAPRPIEQYATVDLTTYTSVGTDHFENENGQITDTIERTSSGYRSVMCSVNFYRDDSKDKARTVRKGLSRETIQDLFKAANIGLIRNSEIRDIDFALEDTWESRAQFDIFLSIIDNDTDIINSINSVDVSSVYESRGLEYNFNIEVN